MISYIVMCNDRASLERNLLRSLRLGESDEIIVVMDKPSAAIAMNIGIEKAKNKIKAFVHSDVVILDNERLRQELLDHCGDATGMVGVIGSKDGFHIPWWEKATCGSVREARLGVIDFDEGHCECAVMDGLFLATAQDFRFDESFKGFHFYDYDSCKLMVNNGLPNWCLRDGKSLMSHNCKTPFDVRELGKSYSESIDLFKKKWEQKEVLTPGPGAIFVEKTKEALQCNVLN